MKIKLMIAVVIACLVFTGFTKENVSEYGRSQRMEDIRRRGHTK